MNARLELLFLNGLCFFILFQVQVLSGQILLLNDLIFA